MAAVCIASAMMAQTLIGADGAPSPLGSRAPKHRVEIVTVPAEGDKAAVEVEFSRRKDSLVDEGVVISRAEWATALDILREQVAGSELLRLVEPTAPVVGTPKEKLPPEEPPLALHARFGASESARQVFLRLVGHGQRHIIASATASGSTMDAVVREALAKIERELILQAWRCRVLDADNEKLIIGRGHSDGLRRGQLLTGYTLLPQGRHAVGQPDEFVLMKFGTRAGTYEIVEAGRDFSRLKPVGQSPGLAVGDVLEIPAVYLRDTNDVTRGTRIWDRLYPGKTQP